MSLIEDNYNFFGGFVSILGDIGQGLVSIHLPQERGSLEYSAVFLIMEFCICLRGGGVPIILGLETIAVLE